LRDCGDGYAVGCLQFGFERVQGVAAARRDDQVAAFGCVVARKLAADASGCASDEGCVGHVGFIL